MNKWTKVEVALCIHPVCRSGARHHTEDGDPWIHAASHPGDAGEL